jgi:hypothetical protein
MDLRFAIFATFALGASSTLGCVAGGDDGARDGESASGSSTGFAMLLEPVVVAEAAAWMPAMPSADPVPEHRPADASCDVGFGLEYGTFEIDTGLCTYAVFEQPAMHDIPAGTDVRVIVVHDHLFAPEPAMAHIVFTIGDAVAFEKDVDVPGPYGLLDEIWVADQDIPIGTPVRLHLHNHGVNSWRVLDIRTL